jgi:hypothetical protein
VAARALSFSSRAFFAMPYRLDRATEVVPLRTALDAVRE